MIAAAAPPDSRDDVRLLVVDPRTDAVLPRRFADLPGMLAAGDLLVVNDAATLPAVLAGHTDAGAAVEVRLIAPSAHGWRAVLFGAGDWRTPTEERTAPVRLAAGDRIQFAGALAARIDAVSNVSPRLVELSFNRHGAELWSAIYRVGVPIQYAYMHTPLALWSVQTVYAARPWAVEMPSAGRPLTWAMLNALRRRGIGVVALTHAAGPSSTGDPRIDAALPLPERYHITAATVAAVAATRAAGGRVIAVGTTVVRALEGCAQTHGELVGGEGETI